MTITSRYPTLDEVVLELAELRPLSAVARRIIEITERERFSAHELAGGIASDPALTAKMLRLANSAYYGFPRRITTVRDAVVLLGFRAVRSTTLATCLIDALPGSTHLDHGRFWQFSLSVGMLAEVLARAQGLTPEEAVTAGVLHNIGRLALDQQVPEGFAHALRHAEQHRIALHEAQHDVLGYSDGELGAALCTHWNFPPPLVAAVADHMLDPDALPEPGSLTAAVVRARIFARAYGLGDGVERSAGAAPDPQWETPPLSMALQQAGGLEGVLERAGAFLDSAIGG